MRLSMKRPAFLYGSNCSSEDSIYILGSEIILEPLCTAIDIVAVAGTLSNVEDGLALIRVLNYKPYSITLKKGLKLVNILYPAAVLINSSL